MKQSERYRLNARTQIRMAREAQEDARCYLWSGMETRFGRAYLRKTPAVRAFLESARMHAKLARSAFTLARIAEGADL